MKKLIITLLFVIFLINLSFSQNWLSISPVYLGLILIDEPTTESMAKVCQQYDLVESEAEDEFQVFSNKDGSKIRFKEESTSKGNVPVVQVISKEKSAKIKDILENTGFTKSSEAYYKGSQFTHRRTKCQLSSGMHPTVTFTKVYRED